MLKTALYNLHLEHNAKMIDFFGWSMPLQYADGISKEHNFCREKAVLFDVSHMGQIELHDKNNGDTAKKELEKLVPSSIVPLKIGKARYSFLTNKNGGIIDDLIISNDGDRLFLVINASRCKNDIEHLQKNLKNVELVKLNDMSLIAIQGPASASILKKIAPKATNLKFMETAIINILDVQCRVSRLGYTGEDGFEISIPNINVEKITSTLLQSDDIILAGLGCRDSLRLEAGLCLYGNDLNETTSPIEANLQWAIQTKRVEEGGFLGEKRILDEIRNKPKQRLCGLQPHTRAPARQGVEIFNIEGQKIGIITSGTFSPSLQKPLSMGYVQEEFSAPNTIVHLMIRGKAVPATITKLPFIEHHYKR